MNPISNKEAYHILKNADCENNDFLADVIDYLNVVVNYSYAVPMNELRKNKKLTSNINALVIASNMGDISILDKSDQDIIKNIAK